MSLRAPTKENTLVLIAVDIGGKNTEAYWPILVAIPFPAALATNSPEYLVLPEPL